MARKKYVEDYYDIDTLSKKYKKDKKKHRGFEFDLNKRVICGFCVAFVFFAGIVYSINSNDLIISVSSEEVITEDVSASEINDATLNSSEITSETQISDITSDNKDFIDSQVQIYENPDIKMYMYVLDNEGLVEYSTPIVQSVNNTYYLDHNLNNVSTKDGAMFLDYNVDINNMPKNVAIYGANLYETSPLYNIDKYNDKAFYDNNKTIKIDTVDKSYYYEIFAFCENNYTYTPEPTEFLTEQGFNNYLEHIENSAIYFDYGVEMGDSILTIATTTNKFNEPRYEIYAKRVG